MVAAQVSYSVVAHPKRLQAAYQLAKATGGQVVLDHGRGSNANHDAAWERAGGDWHVVLEDDAILVPGFTAQVTAALAAVPAEGAVSFYVGTGRPKPTEAPRAIEAARRSNAHWVKAQASYWGVALALPTYLVPDMLGYVQHSTLPYDVRFGLWLRSRKLPCWYTVPSLVDHSDNPSLIWDYNLPSRKAIFVGRNTKWNDTFVSL